MRPIAGLRGVDEGRRFEDHRRFGSESRHDIKKSHQVTGWLSESLQDIARIARLGQVPTQMTRLEVVWLRGDVRGEGGGLPGLQILRVPR